MNLQYNRLFIIFYLATITKHTNRVCHNITQENEKGDDEADAVVKEQKVRCVFEGTGSRLWKFKQTKVEKESY